MPCVFGSKTLGRLAYMICEATPTEYALVEVSHDNCTIKADEVMAGVIGGRTTAGWWLDLLLSL